MTRMLTFLVVAAAAITIAACDTTGEQAMVPGAKYSMNVEDGRFHNIHATGQKLACETCHAGTEYQPDFVTLSKYADDGGASPGIVDRAACLGCHKAGGIATAWYGGRATR